MKTHEGPCVKNLKTSGSVYQQNGNGQSPRVIGTLVISLILLIARRVSQVQAQVDAVVKCLFYWYLYIYMLLKSIPKVKR